MADRARHIPIWQLGGRGEVNGRLAPEQAGGVRRLARPSGVNFGDP